MYRRSIYFAVQQEEKKEPHESPPHGVGVVRTRQYRTLKFAAGPLWTALFLCARKIPPSPLPRPSHADPRLAASSASQCCLQQGPHPRINLAARHLSPFSHPAGREHERLSARPQQTIPLCTQKAKNLRFRKEAETRMDTRCQIC